MNLHLLFFGVFTKVDHLSDDVDRAAFGRLCFIKKKSRRASGAFRGCWLGLLASSLYLAEGARVCDRAGTAMPAIISSTCAQDVARGT